MRFLAHPADEGACGFYRLALPANALIRLDRIEGAVQQLTAFDPLFLQKNAITNVIVQRQTEPHQAVLIESYQRYKIQVTHDLDDLLWDAPAYNPYRKMFTLANRKSIDKVLAISDVLTASTVPLADKIKRKTKRSVSVIPNMIPPNMAQPIRQRVSPRLRIGWAGSLTHFHDLDDVMYVIRSTLDKYQWVFFGWCPEDIKPRVEFHPFVKFDEYMQKLASLQLDVALAPLLPNHFNECKSNLKLLEYGILGYPVISTDVYPYKDNPCVKVKPGKKAWKEWLGAIEAYDANESLRLDHANRAQQYAQLFDIGVPANRALIRKGWGL